MKKISLESLKEKLLYCPVSGLFVWKTKAKRGKQLAGDIAGSMSGNGYMQIKIDGRVYQQHRLAYMYVYGDFVGEIDHINGVKDDNRILNLRTSTRSENLRNIQKVRKTSRAKILGVTYDKRRKKYVAQISINGKHKHIGQFNSAEEAGIEYLKIKREVFPSFAG